MSARDGVDGSDSLSQRKIQSMEPECLELELINSTYSEIGRASNPTHGDGAMLQNSNTGESSAGSDHEKKLPLLEAVKLYPKVVRYCLSLTLAVIGWGYDLVIVGSIISIDSFKNDYGRRHEDKMIIPVNWTSMWLGLPLAGTALGAISGGALQDRIGRQYGLMLGSIISGIAVSIIFFSFMPPDPETKRTMYTIGVTIQGVSVGIIKNACMTYISENAPTAIRASVMALVPTCTLLGQLIGLVVVYVSNNVEGKNGYVGAFGSQWALSLAPFIVSILMPDSPAYYVNRGKEEQALRSCVKLYAPKVDPDIMLNKVRETIDEERAMTKGASYLTCFKGTHLRRTLIVFLAHTIQALFGLDLLSNASLFLTTLGMESSSALLVMMGGIVAGLLANGASIWVLSKIGRRPATLVTLGIAAALWGIVGIAGIWPGEPEQYTAAALMIAIIVVCGVGCWPAGYGIIGETSSLRLRAKTQALGAVAAQCSSITMAVLLPYIFQPDAGDFGGKTGFVYTGLCLFGVVAGWFWLPEMKGRSALEIDHMFDMKVPTRRFKAWRMTE